MECFDICFIILHFLDAEMTSICVNSIIESFSDCKFFIEIVDNGSANNSNEVLMSKYSVYNNIHISINEKNLGFANGNNTGYIWAKSNLKFKFLCVLNNDIVINQKNIFDVLCSEYNNFNFSVLGPDIISDVNGSHQNPYIEKGFSLKELEKYKSVLYRRRKFYFLYYHFDEIKKILRLLRKNNKKENINSNVYLRHSLNPVLHGACYFFSSKFFESRELLFNPNTFMYFEENILHYECVKNSLNMIYSPCICVRHCEDVSTKVFIRNNYKREKWILNECIKSVEIFLELMNNDVKNGIVVFDYE